MNFAFISYLNLVSYSMTSGLIQEPTCFQTLYNRTQ